MKKRAIIIFLILALIATFSLLLLACDKDSGDDNDKKDDAIVFVGDLGLELDEDGTYYTVKTCYLSGEKIVIPSEYEGIPIKEIGRSAFEGCSGLISVEIPSSVTDIGERVFSHCSSLTSIFIPSTVVSLGSGAFYDCANLTVYCEAEVMPSEWERVMSCNRPIVWNCSEYGITEEGIKWGLTKDGVMTIAGYCGTSTEVTIPSKIEGRDATDVSSYAFSGCNNLISIDIPNSVLRIGENSFHGCDSLEIMKLPIAKIKNGEIEKDFVLRSIFAASSFDKVSDSLKEIIITGGETIGSGAFYNCTSLIKVEISDSVTSIGDRAFYGCSSLLNIKIPDSVTSIGISAFYGCNSLLSAYIPSSVTSVGNALFYNCDKLAVYCEAASQPRGWYSTWNDRGHRPVIWNCSEYGNTEEGIKWCLTKSGLFAVTGYYGSLMEITIPNTINGNTVTRIVSFAFYNCSGLTSVELPSSLTSIGAYAFSDCSNLTSIEIPSSVTSIGDYAFSDCSSLASVIFAEDSQLDSIAEWTFADCSSLLSINLPSNINKIGWGAFNYCISLTSIEIPSSVTSIERFAFKGCSSLTSIEIPSSVTSISKRAFEMCSSLTSIVIPSSVTNIGEFAFWGCSSLTIYCEAESKPDGWDSYWTDCPVIWGHKPSVGQ